jgi:hypothetical protein
MNINFEHRSAAHCEAGVVSNLLSFYGYQLSEPMVFGIGAGLYFIYLPFLSLNSSMPICNFRTIPGAVFSRTMKNLHIKVGMKRFFNQEKAMKEMDKLLAEGKPVGNVVGLYFLPYVPREARTVLIHFNAHHICIIGKDGDEYTVSDSITLNLQKISYNDLKRIRFSKGILKPRGKMYWIKEKPTDISYLHHAIIKGIKRTCKNILGTPLFPYIGVRGMVILSKQMRFWEEKYGEKDAMLYLAQIIKIAEELGTGGVGFRFMYGAFLYEAADILNQPKLKNFSVEMNHIGDLWRAFALECGRKFKNRNSISFNDLSDRLLEIAAAEKEFFVNLKRYIKIECKI